MRPALSRLVSATISSSGAVLRSADFRRAAARQRAHRTSVEMPPRRGRVRRWMLALLPWLALVGASVSLVRMAFAPSSFEPSSFETALAGVSAVLAVVGALIVVSSAPPK